MTGSWLITLSWFVILFFIIRKVKFFLPENIPFQLVALSFTLKCAGAILMGLVYTYYYKGGDTFVLFSDSSIMFEALKSHPADYFKMLFGIDSGNDYLKEMYYSKMNAWYNNEFDLLFNDSRIIIRINSVLRIFSFGEYYVHAIFFSFLSFAGLTALYRAFSSAVKKHHQLFYAGIFFLPSVAFWGSGALKEAIVLFAAGFLVYSSLRLMEKKSIVNFLILISSVFLLVLTRFYFLIALFPGLTGLLIASNRKNVWQKFAVTHLVWFVALYSFYFVNPSCDVPCIIAVKQNNFVNLANYSKSGSIITQEKLKPDWSDILKKSPAAFIIALTQPQSFSKGNIFLRIASLETLFILLMLIEAIILFRVPSKEDVPLLLFCLSFTVITFTFLGLTTPVAGTFVRYKIIALPFLIFLAGYFISNSKLFVKNTV